ncbi:MAG: HEAT repeat domain-containing protein [Nitrospirota bacterium]
MYNILIMADEIERIPIDARLLSDAIIELNISRRNVAIYPKDHPSVEKSLNRAFEFLQRLFELRPEITLAVAKDTLIIDEFYLDKKNAVFREFALHLSRLNIAALTFVTGLTKDELYDFHRFISEKASDQPVDAIQEAFKGLNLIHLKVAFIDYRAFTFEEGKTKTEAPGMQLWERYVYGLLEGSLQTADIPDEFKEIPPDVLARFLNRTQERGLKEETYDKVITTYMRRSSESAFSSQDLRRLLDFINGLRPELKKQFLSSTARTFSADAESTYRALRDVSVDEIIELLGAMNEQKMAIPEALKNLLDKLSEVHQDGLSPFTLGGGLLVDDIFLSPDIVGLFERGGFDAHVSDTYQKEIQKLLDFQTTSTVTMLPKEAAKDFEDDVIERDFNGVILELLVSDLISEEEYGSFVSIVREQTDQFLWTGQYGQILRALEVFEKNSSGNRFPDISSGMTDYYRSAEFILKFIDSLRILGRQMREEAWSLCSYYGDAIIPHLLDALAREESQTVRKFFMGLLKNYGDSVIPEAVKRLGDSRWFVKRNILYILGECGHADILPHVRPYCRHENRKVSFEAVKCLLGAGDPYGITVVKEFLSSDSRDLVEQAIILSGAFRVVEVVPDLLRMLRKRGIGGADLYDKIPLVRTLGEIGDPRALDVMRDLLSSKSILFKGVAEKLKEEIFRTLKHYPHESVRDIVETGLKSKNDFIREESVRLSKRGTQ